MKVLCPIWAWARRSTPDWSYAVFSNPGDGCARRGSGRVGGRCPRSANRWRSGRAWARRLWCRSSSSRNCLSLTEREQSYEVGARKRRGGRFGPSPEQIVVSGFSRSTAYYQRKRNESCRILGVTVAAGPPSPRKFFAWLNVAPRKFLMFKGAPSFPRYCPFRGLIQPPVQV